MPVIACEKHTQHIPSDYMIVYYSTEAYSKTLNKHPPLPCVIKALEYNLQPCSAVLTHSLRHGNN